MDRIDTYIAWQTAIYFLKNHLVTPSPMVSTLQLFTISLVVLAVSVSAMPPPYASMPYAGLGEKEERGPMGKTDPAFPRPPGLWGRKKRHSSVEENEQRLVSGSRMFVGKAVPRMGWGDAGMSRKKRAPSDHKLGQDRGFNGDLGETERRGFLGKIAPQLDTRKKRAPSNLGEDWNGPGKALAAPLPRLGRRDMPWGRKKRSLRGVFPFNDPHSKCIAVRYHYSGASK